MSDYCKIFVECRHLPYCFCHFTFRLVEVGDWEGVVLAAAQFEGQQSDIGSNDGSQDHVLDDGSEPSLLAKGNHDRLEGIRAEVELLVRRIVPDELGKLSPSVCLL